MNAKQAREISLEKVLRNLGCEPAKSNENENWYLSPFRIEKTASFKLNRKMNRWFDHGEQKGGNVIDFLIEKFGFSVTEALSYLEKFDAFYSFHKQIFETSIDKIRTKQIEKIVPIKHLALIQYLKGRKIFYYKEIEQLNEIHYTIKNKKYFAIGFENNSQGWEIRSKYAKLCLEKKDVTLIVNLTSKLRIFEGFFDYLSFEQIRNKLQMDISDYLILNSVALIEKNILMLEVYKHIELYLDNDTTGDKYTQRIIDQYPEAKDVRSIYFECKDLNEFLCTIDTFENINIP